MLILKGSCLMTQQLLRRENGDRLNENLSVSNEEFKEKKKEGLEEKKIETKENGSMVSMEDISQSISAHLGDHLEILGENLYVRISVTATGFGDNSDLEK